MGSPDARDLKTRATQLRALAADIEALPGKARDFAMRSMTGWEGPHADRTRGALADWRTKCHTIAENLRQEANDCDRNATDLTRKPRG